MDIEAILEEGHKSTLRTAMEERIVKAKYNLTQIENHLPIAQVVESNLQALKGLLEEIEALNLYLRKMK